MEDALLRQARASGQLNLSARGLTVVPEAVWRIHLDASCDAGATSFDSEDRWWDQVSPSPDDMQTLGTVLDIHDNLLVHISSRLGSLQQLRALNLAQNRLSSFPPAILQLSQLQSLKLSCNAIPELPHELGRLVELRELDISENQLAALPDSLTACRHLERLACSKNKIAQLPDQLQALQNLKEFDVIHNGLIRLPALERLEHIVRLDLRYNRLERLPNLAAMAHLKELHAGYNRLQTLGDIPSVLPAGLMILDLRDNRLQEIPASLAHLTFLERLELSNNDIAALPPELGLLRNLKAIVLDGNPLRSLRRDIVRRGTRAILEHLRSRLVESSVEQQAEPERAYARQVDERHVAASVIASNSFSLAEQGLDTIPDHMWQPTEGVGLERLDLSKNKLRDLPARVDSFSSTLTTLSLAFNQVERLSSAVGLLQRLVSLDLRRNRLASLPEELSLLVGLRELALGFNRFVALPTCIGDLRALETLVVNDNQLGAIDVTMLAKLPALGCLDVSNNAIQQVPAEMGLLPLKMLRLEGNLFRVPRPNILAKGTPAVLEYLKSRLGID